MDISSHQNNSGANSINYEEKYKKLKKKYNLLLQEHQKVLNEFEKSNEGIRQLYEEKQFLKTKITDILKKGGFNIKSFAKEEASVAVLKQEKKESQDDNQFRQEDSAMQQE